MAIISKLDNCGWLFRKHKALNQLYAFFEICLQNGYKKKDYKNSTRIDLDSGIFAMLQTYKLKSYKDAFFETHKKYVDFQLTISGCECFMIGDSRDFEVIKSYNSEKDLIVYKSKKCTHRIISNNSCLCVFFPNDVHAGGLKHKCITNNHIYKIVAKVPKTLLESYIMKPFN